MVLSEFLHLGRNRIPATPEMNPDTNHGLVGAASASSLSKMPEIYLPDGDALQIVEKVTSTEEPSTAAHAVDSGATTPRTRNTDTVNFSAPGDGLRQLDDFDVEVAYHTAPRGSESHLLAAQSLALGKATHLLEGVTSIEGNDDIKRTIERRVPPDLLAKDFPPDQIASRLRTAMRARRTIVNRNLAFTSRERPVRLTPTAEPVREIPILNSSPVKV